MKFDVLKSDQGVEIHLLHDDNTKTIWLCDDDQVAIFKLASLLFSKMEPPKQAKRAILLGDFEVETTPEKTMAERGEDVKKRLAGEGLVPKKAPTPTPVLTPAVSPDIEKMLEEFQKLTKSTPNYPYKQQPIIQPYMGDGYPYIGDPLPFPGGQIYGAISTDGTGGGCAGASGIKVEPMNFCLNDSEVSKFSSNGLQTTVYKTSFKAAG